MGFNSGFKGLKLPWYNPRIYKNITYRKKQITFAHWCCTMDQGAAYYFWRIRN